MNLNSTEIKQSALIGQDSTLWADFTDQVKNNAFSFGLKIILALVIFIILSKLIKWIRKIVKKSLQKKDAGLDKIKVVDSIIKVVLYAIVFTMMFGYLGIEVSSLFAILASVGFTAGLAFQGALSNFAGGVLIVSARPFKLGDYITVPGQDLEGTVVDMGFVYTKILTRDQKIIILPNGALANQNIINASVKENRRLELDISITYSSDIDKARKTATEALASSGRVINNNDIDVFVTSLGESSVNLMVRCWVPSKDFLATKWALTEVIKKSFDQNGIEFPFPQLDVHMK